MEKINIAELLKDCPKGMELDCTTWENVTFEEVRNNTIIIRRNNKEPYFDTKVNLNQYGCCTNYSDEKCVIFPKGKTTWEGFTPPCKFKDGDVLYVDCTDEYDDKQYDYIFILDKIYNGQVYTYCYYYILNDDFRFKENEIRYLTDDKYPIRFATKKEKAKLFKAIKNNGYKWNDETKTLEKLVEPKFKVGDKIKDKNNKIWFVVQVSDKHFSISLIPNAEGYFVPIEDQDEYELVPNKFDIATLKPFDKVLVRDGNKDKWNIDFFGYYRDDGTYQCMTFTKNQCIPYEVNKELLGTTNNPKGYGSE